MNVCVLTIFHIIMAYMAELWNCDKICKITGKKYLPSNCWKFW